MKKLLLFASFFCASFSLNAARDTFSSEKLQGFYDEFIKEQRTITNEAKLTSGEIASNGQTHFTPPPDPPAPPIIPPPSGVANLLPIVLVNNSGLGPENVYIVMTVGSTQFLSFDSSGIGSLVTAQVGQSETLYNKSLMDLPAASGGYVIYLPQDQTQQLASANLWISTGAELHIPINPGGTIAQPSPTDLDPNNPDRFTSFDFFEITINPANSPSNVAMVFCDLTAVTDFSLSLYAYLSTPNSSPSPDHPDPYHLGLIQPRNYIFQHIENEFDNAGEATEWKKLLIRDTSNNIVRVLSTQKSISISPSSSSPDSFSYEYLNPSSGYNYIQDVLNFFTTNTASFTTPPVGVYPSINFTGNTSGNSLALTSTSNGDISILLDTTGITFDIFSSNGPPISGTAPADVQTEMNKLFTQSIIIGFTPTTNNINKPDLNLDTTRQEFYTYNSNLSTTAATGPWYDLYSKAIHQLGTIYTSGFDDEIYPSVQLVSQTIEGAPNPTYVGITINNVTQEY